MIKIILLIVLLSSLTFSLQAQWTQLTSPSTSPLYCADFINASNGYISGSLNGVIIKTTDGGTSWVFTNTGTTSTFYDLIFSDQQNGFASGTNRQILRTTNAGLNWDIKTSGIGTLYSISIPSSIAYSDGGSPSSFMKSSDGGNNWTSLTPPTSNILRGVYFANGTVGWVCGDFGTMWQTTDGGTSWIPQTQLSSYSFEDIRFHSLTNGFVCGSPGIMRTTNGGMNWFSVYSGSVTLYDMYFLNSVTGWAVGASGRIVKTTDGGNNWYTQTTMVSTTLNSIDMVDANTGYIVGNSGVLLKTTNGGGAVSIPCFTKITNDPVVNDLAPSEGCSWGDYDNDGDQDLVVTTYNDACQSCNYPILLYRNDGGSFTRIMTGPIATEMSRTFAAAWGDYDNDSKLDLFICTGANLNNLLFHNEGNGNFTKITSGNIVNDGGNSGGCTWLDYDRDGWLDLFVTNKNNENDFLYKNNGNGTFTKITGGSIVNDGLNDRGCSAGDYNNDGWTDILIICYQGQSDRLYKNNGDGTFSLTLGVIPNDNDWGSGSSFADYDNDGWLDIFITNNNSNNILYHNNGNNTFTRIINGPGGESGPLSYGCTWADYDNDGFLDLYVSNYGSPNLLYRNLGNGSFIKVAGEIIVSEMSLSIGNSHTDFNLDGKIDFFSANNGSNSPQNDLFYANNCASGNYIVLKLKGCNLNKSAIGTRINLYSAGNRYIREVSGGDGCYAQNMLWQHFGIGNATLIDSIVVKWTTGVIQRLNNVTPNQYILIDECTVGIISNTSQIPSFFTLSQNYPNPFNPSTKIKFGLPKSSNVILKLYNNLGKEITTILKMDLQAGIYEYDFDAFNLTSGIYFYKITADGFVDTKKMVIIK